MSRTDTWIFGTAAVFLVALLVFLGGIATGRADQGPDCRPRHYAHNVWTNSDGDIVASSKTEDSTLTWLGDCK
jgi:hypothetical protein